MIKIGDTGLLEGLPPGIAEQHWVKVIDAVYRERLKKELKVIERIHVYTAIDSLPEDLLDVLAVQFKVDWYRDDYQVETKRRVIKTAMEVRRYCGTEWAVKQAISAIYPNSEIVEWYDYGGTPGHWRLRVNITENADISYYTIKRMEDLLGYARRCTAHLEGISYLIFNNTTTAYVGAGYHGTTQRVAVPIAGTLRPRELLSSTYAKAGVWGTRQQESTKIIGILRPKDHKAATYAPVGCAAIRMQMTAYIKGNIRPADHKATTLAPAGIAAYRQQIEVRIGGMNT